MSYVMSHDGKILTFSTEIQDFCLVSIENIHLISSTNISVNYSSHDEIILHSFGTELNANYTEYGFTISSKGGNVPDILYRIVQEEQVFLYWKAFRFSWLDNFKNIVKFSIKDFIVLANGLTIESLQEVEDTSKIIAFYDSWRFEQYHLFNPMIYFCAFGSIDMANCLEQSLYSLINFSKWKYNIVLITDIEIEKLKKVIPNDILLHLQIYHTEAKDLLEYTVSRYNIFEYKCAKMSNPIIYSDIDIVFDSKIDEIVKECAITEMFYIASEGPVGDGTWFGGNLFFDEGKDISAEPGLNSGFFMLKNNKQNKEIMRITQESIYNFSKKIGSRIFLELDQPFLNYSLRKIGTFNCSEINSILDFCGSGDYVSDHRKGVVHFLGGVGKSEKKLTRMTDYINKLKKGLPL